MSAFAKKDIALISTVCGQSKLAIGCVLDNRVMPSDWSYELSFPARSFPLYGNA